MPYDVFICHCSEDKPTADAICATLERNHHRCWIAPRDILPGKPWGEAIIEAIGECELMIVVFSSHCNESTQVMREVERAVGKGIPIIPFRIEDVLPSRSLEYFLSTPHWLDALTPPLEDHIDRLTRTVGKLLNTGEKTGQEPFPKVVSFKETAHDNNNEDSPHLTLEYEVDSLGEKRLVKLPFVTGVMADLSGANSADLLPPVANRSFIIVNEDNFDAVLRRSTPRVMFDVPSVFSEERRLEVDLCFKSFEDFAPTAIARRLVPLAEQVEIRRKLLRLHVFLDTNPAAQKILSKLIANENLCQDSTTAQSTIDSREPHPVDCFVEEIEQALDRQSDVTRTDITDAFTSIADHLHNTRMLATSSPRRVIESIIKNLDSRLSQQINLIIHHEEFQRLHGTWLSLSYLVNHTNTSQNLKIRVLNITKQELSKILRKYKGVGWDQSPLFKKIYDEEYGVLGGEPFGLLVGDYNFDHSPADTELLSEISKIAASAYAPFVTGASSSLFTMDSWAELNLPHSLSRIFSMPEYRGWHSLRESPDSCFLALTIPRYLVRLPYQGHPSSAQDFHFEEDIDIETFTWSNSAYALAVNIHRSFANCGLPSHICGVEAGGLVEGMLSCSFETIRGFPEIAGPAEVSINDRRESEIGELGLVPLIQMRHGTGAVFMNTDSLQKRAAVAKSDLTSAARLASKLQNLLTICRFNQYVKCIIRDRAQSFRSAEQAEHWLRRWILNYVSPPSQEHSRASRITRPLSAADIKIEGEAGAYQCHISVTPHHSFMS